MTCCDTPAQLRVALVLLFTLVGYSVYGCSIRGVQSVNGSSPSDVLAAFKSGDARLTCGVTCSGSWGAVRRRAKSLYENQLWNDLALEVAKVGEASDLPYFYWGRSAEGMGYTVAARTYYGLALGSSLKCDGLLNNCDGFVFPKDISDRLGALALTAKANRAEAPKSPAPARQQEVAHTRVTRATATQVEDSMASSTVKPIPSPAYGDSQTAPVLSAAPTNYEGDMDFGHDPISKMIKVRAILESLHIDGLHCELALTLEPYQNQGCDPFIKQIGKSYFKTIKVIEELGSDKGFFADNEHEFSEIFRLNAEIRRHFELWGIRVRVMHDITKERAMKSSQPD